jgi:hypothetical protein
MAQPETTRPTSISQGPAVVQITGSADPRVAA